MFRTRTRATRLGALVVLLPLALASCRGGKSGDVGPCDGHYAIASSSDLDAVARCDDISGIVSIQALDWLTAVELPNLESADSVTIVGNSALTHVDLRGLESVQGTLEISDNGSLTTIRLHNLSGVKDRLYVTGNDALTAPPDVPRLKSVGGHLHFEDNACMSQTDAKATAGRVEVGGKTFVFGNGAAHPCR